jgi:hypothetical protein
MSSWIKGSKTGIAGFRRGRVEFLHVLDSLVRHIGDQVIAGFPDPWKGFGWYAEEVRRPLIGLPTHEPVEVFEAHSDGPLVKGSRHRVLKAGCIVLLAKPGRGVAALFEDLADSGGGLLGFGNLRGSGLRDHSFLSIRSAGGLFWGHSDFTACHTRVSNLRYFRLDSLKWCEV